jgi:hypothetical protein
MKTMLNHRRSVTLIDLDEGEKLPTALPIGLQGVTVAGIGPDVSHRKLWPFAMTPEPLILGELSKTPKASAALPEAALASASLQSADKRALTDCRCWSIRFHRSGSCCHYTLRFVIIFSQRRTETGSAP